MHHIRSSGYTHTHMLAHTHRPPRHVKIASLQAEIKELHSNLARKKVTLGHASLCTKLERELLFMYVAIDSVAMH